MLNQALAPCTAPEAPCQQQAPWVYKIFVELYVNRIIVSKLCLESIIFSLIWSITLRKLQQRFLMLDMVTFVEATGLVHPFFPTAAVAVSPLLALLPPRPPARRSPPPGTLVIQDGVRWSSQYYINRDVNYDDLKLIKSFANITSIRKSGNLSSIDLFLLCGLDLLSGEAVALRLGRE